MKRRNFIRNSGLLALTLSGKGLIAESTFFVKEQTTEVLNFNVAAAAIPAKEVLDEQIKWSKQISKSSPYKIWNENQILIDNTRRLTANMIDADENEIALCRNATEGIDTILRGIDFIPDEEVVYSNYDFPYVQGTVKQLQDRYGIKALKAKLDIAKMSDEEIVVAYKTLINNRTRLVILTHAFNWNGRITPFNEIVKTAKHFNADILIDGAQSFAHFPVSVKDLRCDYFVSCFHKWFRGSLGTAFIYIRKDKIKDIWPLHGEIINESESIEKLNELSTLNFQGFLSLNKRFNNVNNDIIKEESQRKKQLCKIIIEEFSNYPGLQFMLPADYSNYYGIVAFELKEMNPGKLTDTLWKKYKIIVKPIIYKDLNGIRISISDEISEKHVYQLTNAIKNEI